MSATSPASAIPPSGGYPLPAGGLDAAAPAGPDVTASAALDAGAAPSVALPVSPGLAVPVTAPAPLPAGPKIGRKVATERRQSRLARCAVGGVVASGTLVAVAAAHTESLLPESIRPVQAALAGAFGSLSSTSTSALPSRCWA